jgi:hypothetical protein
MRRESPNWWFWMSVGVGAILPLLTGVVVWIVLQLQGRPVLGGPTILKNWLLWIIMAVALGVAAIPTALLVRYLAKDSYRYWARAAAWGMLLGLAVTIVVVFASLWQDAGSAIDVVVMAPHVLAVMHTIGAVAGGLLGMLAARALHSTRGGHRVP